MTRATRSLAAPKARQDEAAGAIAELRMLEFVEEDALSPRT